GGTRGVFARRRARERTRPAAAPAATPGAGEGGVPAPPAGGEPHASSPAPIATITATTASARTAVLLSSHRRSAASASRPGSRYPSWFRWLDTAPTLGCTTRRRNGQRRICGQRGWVVDNRGRVNRGALRSRR